MENILTLGKLLSLWFCFLLHSILLLISQTSYRTYKIISSYELTRPVMGTIFLVITHYQCIHNHHGFIYFYVMSFIFCIWFHLDGLILFNDIVVLFLLKGVLGSSQLQIIITPVVWLL